MKRKNLLGTQARRWLWHYDKVQAFIYMISTSIKINYYVKTELNPSGTQATACQGIKMKVQALILWPTEIIYEFSPLERIYEFSPLLWGAGEDMY